MTPKSNGHSTDSKGVHTVAIDYVCENIVRPVDPERKDYLRLVELKRRFDEAKEKGMPFSEPINVEFTD